ncbi:MAG TPA: hypothetical protein VHT95_11915 [Vicinamibacterales bacterium]|nr:hypothetical protein [Vicinamibacterales bacterium]
MRAMLIREALVVARRPAVVSIVVVYSGLLALFLSAWGGQRVPMLPGATVYAQLQLLQCALLIVVMPWAAARTVATERADDLVRLSAILAIPPSRVIIARLLAAAIAPALVVAGALPVALIAQQMSAVPVSRALADQITLLTFALPAAVVAVWWMQISSDRLLGWLGATASTMLLVTVARFVFPGALTAAVVAAACAMAGGAMLASRADLWWRHLRGESA